MKDVVKNIRRKARYIIELRYEVIPEFIDTRGSIISKIHPIVLPQFRHWQLLDNQILFTDVLEKPTMEFLISANRISVIFEDAASLQAFIDQAIKLSGLAYDALGGRIKKIDRLGSRFIEVISSKDNTYDATLRKVLQKFHQDPVKLPLEYLDSLILMIHKYGRYSIGPTRKNDEWVMQNFKYHENNIPDVGIAVDIDSYATNIGINSKNDLKIGINAAIDLTVTIEEALLRGVGALDG